MHIKTVINLKNSVLFFGGKGSKSSGILSKAKSHIVIYSLTWHLKFFVQFKHFELELNSKQFWSPSVTFLENTTERLLNCLEFNYTSKWLNCVLRIYLFLVIFIKFLFVKVFGHHDSLLRRFNSINCII